MARFRERDIRRAIRAVEKETEKKVAAVEIDSDGKIIVIVGKPDDDENKQNELDNWMQTHARAAEGH
jgi:hypothetical protein